MEIMSAKELSKYLGTSEETISRMVQESKIPAVRIGGRTAFARELVDDWMSENARREKVCFLAGSDDPLLQEIIDLFNASRRGTTVFYAPVGSLRGLELLKEHAASASCVHIYDVEKRDYTLSYLGRYLESENYLALNLFFREEGLYLPKGNPLGITSLADLASGVVRFINRSKGTGTRFLFDSLITEAGIEPSRINGYDRQTESHLSAGTAVLRGVADASMGIRYIAHILSLDFVPLFKERFDFVVPRQGYTGAQTKAFLDFLREPFFLHSIKDHAGYDMSQTGSVLNKDVR